jgi:sec-independent protein translocase protein TatB
MFLFIFESIGTQELLLIGIVALIFLGPRRMPEMARKLGKIMSDFKNTTSEFKATWEREVNFEEDAKALTEAFSDEDIDAKPVPRENSILSPKVHEVVAAPEIRQADPGLFDHLENSNGTEPPATEVPHVAEEAKPVDLNAKENWL